MPSASSGGFDATLIKPITFASLTQAIGSPERG